jgi:hypothetical protein
MEFYTYTVLQRIKPPYADSQLAEYLDVGSEYDGGIIKGGNAKDGFVVMKRKTVEAENTRKGWMLTGWPKELKKHSSVNVAQRNTLLYDETNRTVGLTYIEEPQKITGSVIYHLQRVDKFLGFTVSTRYVPVYFLLKSEDGTMRSYQRPTEILYSPEDFYDATQWKKALDIFKNTSPMLEKITSIIWAAAGLLSLMVLFMLIFAGGV